MSVVLDFTPSVRKRRKMRWEEKVNRRKGKEWVWDFCWNSKQLSVKDVRHCNKGALPGHDSEIAKKRFVSGTTFIRMAQQRTNVKGQVILADRQTTNCVVP